MHDSVLLFVARHAHLAVGADVLEVGSVNINGGVRELLDPLASSYVGVDIVDGPGVDVVSDAESLSLDWSGQFDLVVSTEMLEHCCHPHIAVDEMARVCGPGGHVLITCRGFDMERGAFQPHNEPDRHRPGPGVVSMWCTDAGLEVLDDQADPQVPGWLVLAKKP